MIDENGRKIEYLRISVTDRCNLRCIYCMPSDGVCSMSHEEVLSYEEIIRLVKIFSTLGINKIKITGGEPLVRKGIVSMINEIKSIPGIEQVTLTTNGCLLCEKLPELKRLDAINISLDTLNPERFKQITRREGLQDVLKAIDMCVSMGINTKINCVAMKGINDSEIIKIAKFAKDKNICVRFIELMPIGKKEHDTFLSNEQTMQILEEEYGRFYIDKVKHGNGPAIYFKRGDFKGSIGVISALSGCFCDTCNRVRLTADGFLKLCLQYDSGISLRDLMRQGKTDDEIKAEIEKAIMTKPTRHSFENYGDKKHIECKTMNKIGG